MKPIDLGTFKSARSDRNRNRAIASRFGFVFLSFFLVVAGCAAAGKLAEIHRAQVEDSRV